MRTHGYTHGAQSPASQSQANSAFSVKQQMKANRNLHGGAVCGEKTCNPNQITIPQFPSSPNLGGQPLVGSNAQSLQGSKHLAGAKVSASGDSAVYAAGNPADPHHSQAGGRRRRSNRRRTRQRGRRRRATRRRRKPRFRPRRRGGRSRSAKANRSRRRAARVRTRKRRERLLGGVWRTGTKFQKPCICEGAGEKYACYPPSKTPNRCKAEVAALKAELEAFKRRRKGGKR